MKCWHIKWNMLHTKQRQLFIHHCINVGPNSDQCQNIIYFRKRSFSKRLSITSKKLWVLLPVSFSCFSSTWCFSIIKNTISVVEDRFQFPDYNIDSDSTSSEDDEVENPIRPNSLSSWSKDDNDLNAAMTMLVTSMFCHQHFFSTFINSLNSWTCFWIQINDELAFEPVLTLIIV